MEPATDGRSGRVWFVCVGPRFTSRSDAEELRGVRRVNNMRCTEEMAFEELCCAPWSEGLEYSRAPAAVSLDAAQEPPSSMLAMKRAEGEASDEITIFCTSDSPAHSIAASKGATGVELPITCASREYSVDALKGSLGPGPGQEMLDLRIEFLSQQGVSPSCIPTCRDSVKECEGGHAPASAGVDILEQLKAGSAMSFLRRTRSLPAVQMTAGTLTLLA